MNSTLAAPTIFRRWLSIVVVIFAVGGLLALSLYAAEQLWTCGMHPQIIKKQPGSCPICGMALTPVRANKAGAPSGERKIKYYKSTMSQEVSPTPAKDSMGMEMVPVYEDQASDTSAINIDPVTIQRMNLKTALVVKGPVRRELRAVGTVAYNEEGLRDITTKYEGWIEKLHVNTTWATVNAGDPLFEIYSPDLYNAQLNYIVALRGEGSEGGPLTKASLARLRLFDVPDEFVAEVARSGEARRTFVFRAPFDGTVIEKMAVAGQMMKAGERIFRLADLTSVWVLAQIYENDLPLVRLGQDANVRVTYGPERVFPAKVGLLLPQVEEQTRTTTARLVVPNPEGALRPGMFVDVRFSAHLTDEAVLVPDTAVLRSGERNTVFLARDNGTFEPREITLGARSEGNLYEVRSGLAVGDRVVVSGQFMLDSESQLREAIQKMMRAEAASAGAKPPATTGSAAPPSGDTAGHAHAAANPEQRSQLKTLGGALADAADALAADNLENYQKSRGALRPALTAFLPHASAEQRDALATFAKAERAPSDLAAARREFEPLSTAVTDLVRQAKLQQEAGVRVFQCPMSPVLGTARWLQRDDQLRNPFFGSAMSSCGEAIN